MTVISAIITSVIGFYRASSRILTNMAEDHILSREFVSPTFCFLFVMVVSILLSLFGRNVLGWVVDLSSFGAIVAFGYTSAAAYSKAKRENYGRMKLLGAGGILASVVFGLAQLVPYLSSVETMDAESYMLLALWCLLGFLFYWRTMRVSADQGMGGEHITITALFTLLFYSTLVWYIKMILRAEGEEAVRAAAARNAFILFGVVLLGLGVMMQIHTQLRKRQLSLERERIHAIESSKAKSRFLFNMSHDIRTPMNAILGFTHLGKQPGQTAEEKDVYFEKIETSGQQLLSIINDVLDMSRIENDKVEPVPANLIGVFEEMRDMFSAQMAEKQIGFTVDTSGVEEPWVLCDRNRLSRVVLNLLSSAVKFTPEGGAVSVTVRQTGRRGENGTYSFGVKDSGIGMSREFLENLFEPFERERTSTVSGIQGTGLGMSITKGIVDRMGGRIQVFSEPGRGTEFLVQVTFPILEPPEEKTAAAETAGIDLSRLRGLLAEDNEINREIAVMVLEQEGITVDTAENGQLAVEKLTAAPAGQYDLVLMDIQMPVMDGYTATRTIRALEDRDLASIPIVAMTANAFAEDVRMAEEAGMNGHVAKPIDIDVMLRTITEVMSRQRQQ